MCREANISEDVPPGNIQFGRWKLTRLHCEKLQSFGRRAGCGRHIPFSFFERLADFPGAQFFSFQQGPCEREAQDSVLPIRRLSKHTVDICDLASALTKMDLVLTVDTMAAHLAGSLRIPVWLLLEGAADWRWIEGRTNSPWYPEMRIFREQHGWEEVIDKLLQEIPRGKDLETQDLSAARSRSPRSRF